MLVSEISVKTRAGEKIGERRGNLLLLNPSEVYTGVRDTWFLLQMRWRNIRSTNARLGILGGAVFVLLGLAAVINLGYAIRVIAQQGEETTAGLFALSWIISLQQNSIGEIGAITLGGALVAAVFSPFTGSSTLSLAPNEDLQGLRLSRLHRFFDSFIINSVSGIGLLQIFALTGITSVLALNGERGPALIVTWGVWVFIIALTTTFGWGLEVLVRRWGTKIRWRLGGVLAILLGAIILLNPNQAFTVFGIGDMYADMVASASSGTFIGFFVPFFIVLFTVSLCMYLGLIFTRRALALPSLPLYNGKKRRSGKVYKTPSALSVQLLLNSIIRSPECSRPIIAIIVVGIPALLVVDMTLNLQTAVMFAIPLAVALAWGVNIFGVLGSGMSWLASRPYILSSIPQISAFLQVIMIVFLTMLLWFPAYLVGNTDSETGAKLLVSSLITGFLSATIAVFLSVHKPIRARLSGRGDTLVPPITTLAYLLILLIFACAPAAIFANTADPLRLIALSISGVIFIVGMKVISWQWQKPTVRTKVVAEVSAN